MLKVGPTFNYRSRPLLEIGLHAVQEWSCDLHLTTLSMAITSVASLSSGCCSRIELDLSLRRTLLETGSRLCHVLWIFEWSASDTTRATLFGKSRWGREPAATRSWGFAVCQENREAGLAT